MREELSVAIDAAKQAAKLMLEYYNEGVVAENKADGSPVTIADKECEKLIIQIISASFPDAKFLSEETHPNFSGDPNSSKWIIDPIDGTKNFVGKKDYFGSIIGFEENGQIVCGVATNPTTGLLMWAETGGGAFANGTRLKAPEITELSEAKLVCAPLDRFTSLPQYEKLQELLETCSPAAKPVDYGSTCPIDCFMLCSGKADLYIADPASKPWDVSAFKIIMNESGAVISNPEGDESIYSSGLKVAANPLLHKKALEFLCNGQ